MISFYLIRHGEKLPTPFDPGLTENGLKQAEAVSKLLKNIQVSEVISSPKLRAKQTAEIIARPHGLTVSLDQRLIERMEWENNNTFEEFITLWSKTDWDRNYYPPLGCSSAEKGNIMRELVDEFSAKYANGTFLIITHGGAIGDLIRNVLGKDAPEEVTSPETGAPHIPISECSITILEKESQVYKLSKLNDVAHLSSL